MRWLVAVVVAGCAAAGPDASPASGGNAQGGAPAGGAAGSGGSVEAGDSGGGADGGADGEAGLDDVAAGGSVGSGGGDAGGTDGGPADAAPEVGLPCDWPAVFAACQSAHPNGAKAAGCACVNSYQGDPNCDNMAACAGNFCASPSKGTGACAGCLGWLNTTWPQKCAPNCGPGTDCAAFFQCVKIKNC